MINKKYDLVLYDLDGTLIDSVPFIVKCFQLCYEDVLGECVRTEEDFKSYIGKPLLETFSMHDEETAQKLFNSYLRINEKMLREDKVAMFPNVYEDLLKIKEQGIKQGIVTSKRKVAAMITIDIKNITPLMDVFVFLEDSKEHKPSGEPLEVAASRLGISDMSKVLYVGDALPDALSAKNAGCDFALVDWSVMPREVILEATKTEVISSLLAISCNIGNSEL